MHWQTVSSFEASATFLGQYVDTPMQPLRFETF